ncbi:alpha/beta hydrolase family protein [Asticcacaulis solisilvae]|uniref:alpha/beta hydrolase family protein n=1 Tax=Asticcacaulis solisilvae TaxID=1217274 RepID=UPI003FD86ECB
MRTLRQALLAVTATAALVSAAQVHAEAVVVHGLKRTRPVDVPPPLELYAKMPHIEQIALSPDGSRVAFTTREDDLRMLAYYRFSDRSRGAIKLTDGDVTALAWADNDHVLASDSRIATRGTCEAAGPRTTGRTDARSAVQSVIDTAAASGKTPPGSPEAAAEQAAALSALDAIQSPQCAFFGIRGENVITSVNVVTGTGMSVGAHIGDARSVSLGIPTRLSSDGPTQLMGPFIELRSQSVGNQPAQRVYLWKVDPETGSGRLVDDGGGDLDRENHYVDDWLFNRDGSLVARTVYDFRDSVYHVEMKSGGKWKSVLSREIVANDHTFAPSLIGVTEDGQAIVILDSETHGRDAKGAERRFHYYRLDASGTLSDKLEAGDASQDRPVFDPRSGRLAGFAHDAEEPQYTISDPDLAAIYRKAGISAPGQTVDIVSITDDLQKALIRTTGGEDTGSFFLLDFASGKGTAIGEDFPQVPTDWIAVQEPMTYKAADGLEINAIVTLPPKPAAKTLPLIVLPHDGPQDHDSFGFGWLAEALASRGYLVLQANYRGSDGHGAAFVAAGYGQWGGKMLSDLKDGVDELVRQGLADPNRVCVIGIGYGGYAALSAAETGDVRCAGAIGGISDVGKYVAWRNTMAPVPDPDAFAGLSPHPQWPRAFRADPASPRSLNLFVGAGAPSISAAAVKAPVLLIHQSGDSVVPAEQSRTLHDALTAAGKRVDYVELKSGGHAPDTQATRLATLQAVMNFLAVNNPASN